MATAVELVAQLGSGEQAHAFAALRQLQRLTLDAGAPGKEVQRAELAAALAAEMNAAHEHKSEKGKISYTPKHGPRVRGTVARLLASVAGESEVAALRQLGEDFGGREMARWALDRMSTPGATAALIDMAQNAVGPEFRIGVLNALGRRSGEDVRVALAKSALDHDEEVRLASAEALANLPAVESDQVFDAVLKIGQPSPPAKRRLVKARLRLAEGLVRAGQSAAGKKIYEAIVAQGADPPQVEAAQSALKALA